MFSTITEWQQFLSQLNWWLHVTSGNKKTSQTLSLSQQRSESSAERYKFLDFIQHNKALFRLMWCSSSHMRKLIWKVCVGLLLLRAENRLLVTGIWCIIWTTVRHWEVLADSDSRNEEVSWEFRSREDLYHIRDIYINKWFMLLQGPLLKYFAFRTVDQQKKIVSQDPLMWVYTVL